jgi:hypothetical protein
MNRSIAYLLPDALNGFPVDVTAADPAIGGFDLLIWRDANRDDGIMVHVDTISDVHRFFREVQSYLGGAK